MKKFVLLALLACVSWSVVAQTVTTRAGKIQRATSDPTGQPCQAEDVRTYNGIIYSCSGGSYANAPSTDSTKIPLAGSSSVSGDITSTAGFFGRKIGGVGYAAEYNGSTDADKISNAAAANNAVFLTTRLGSTTSMSTNLTPNVLHFDFRRGAAWDYTNGYSTSFSGGYSIAQKLTADYTSGGNPSLINLFLNPQQGGVNANLNKTNYSGSFMQILKQTPGQTNGYSVILNANSPGDAQGHVAAIRYAGHVNAPGDEGAVGSRVQIDIGGIYLATVGSIDSSTLTMSSQSGTYSRGQGRYLINTNASKTYSVGSVLSFSGTPPVVTFSGTTLTSLGSGTVSNLCFAMDSDTTTFGHKHVVPIKSIDSNTQVTLNYQLIGLDYSWPSGLATSGNYKIYKCSTISKVNDSTIEVTDPSVFAATDTVESPLLYGPNLVGAKIVYSLAFPGGIGSGGLSLDNQNDLVPVDVAIAVSGKHKNAAKFTSQLTEGGILFYESVGSSGHGPLLSLAGTAISDYVDVFQSLNNAGNAVSHLRYNKSTDKYSFGTASGEVFFSNTGALTADGAIQGLSLKATGLTSGRLPQVSTGGLITDSANLTFSDASSILTVAGASNPKLQLSNTTASKVLALYAGSSSAALGLSGSEQLLFSYSAPAGSIDVQSNRVVLGLDTLITTASTDLQIRAATNGNAGSTVKLQGFNGSAWQTVISAPNTSSGNVKLLLAENGGLVGVGGSTSSFPALKRNSTAINFRLADDSADAPITASTGGFSGSVTVTGGDVIAATAGKSLQIKTGSNACAGTSTLSSGSVVVSTTCVGTLGTDTIIQLTPKGSSTGVVRVSATTANTSFTITSSDAASGDDVYWTIIKIN